MSGSNFIAWASLILTVIGIILLIRRLIIRAGKKRAVSPLPEAPSLTEWTPEHAILVLNKGEQLGPYTLAEVTAFTQGGRFADDAVYWQPGQDDWKPVKSLLLPGM